ncbi:MAG TPA: hypothetical protein VLY21_00780 [Nitrososphaerales archaeon]|nr:hypothetical protein [Nitrososphaerales archaeon]
MTTRVKEFFRRCPACGKRFSVRLEKKVLTKDEHGVEETAYDVVLGWSATSQVLPAPVTHQEIPVERETFDLTYECVHCHHEWTETINVVQKD